MYDLGCMLQQREMLTTLSLNDAKGIMVCMLAVCTVRGSAQSPSHTGDDVSSDHLYYVA